MAGSGGASKGKAVRRIARALTLNAVLLACAPLTAQSADQQDTSRLSDKPVPLQLEDFPERPPPLLELGDRFLDTGNLQRGFTLPTGAVWSPSFWVFGTLRSAVQTFDPGYAPATSEWANRLDLFGNLQLSATERVLVGFRPVDQNTTPARFSGYQFEPPSSRGWVDAFSATPRTLFFEGELGEIFPHLDKNDKLSLDYGIAVGRQPLILQDGILVNDDSIDMVSITRNALRIPGGSTLRLSGYYAWDQIERADNVRDYHASLIGVNAAADFPVSTVEADVAGVTSITSYDANRKGFIGGSGVYAGLGAIQRIGKFNTVFRVAGSLATEKETLQVRNGALLFSEISYTPWYSHDLIYLNAFYGIRQFSSADRAPSAGGPLGRVGILFADVGLGRYGAPLGSYSDYAAGGALGYQKFFGELKRRQLIVEIGGRQPTRAPQSVEEQPAVGIGARFQQAIGRRFILLLDAFGVLREESEESWGGRVEWLVKF